MADRSWCVIGVGVAGAGLCALEITRSSLFILRTNCCALQPDRVVPSATRGDQRVLMRWESSEHQTGPVVRGGPDRRWHKLRALW